jgi:hypothetical protein
MQYFVAYFVVSFYQDVFLDDDNGEYQPLRTRWESCRFLDARPGVRGLTQQESEQEGKRARRQGDNAVRRTVCRCLAEADYG